MALNLIMLGPPGAGKGTQAERVGETYGIPKISTGDILRDAVARDTELGRVARELMDAGQLVSDDVMIGVVRERLSRSDTARGFILDGFPRTVGQARAFEPIVENRGPLLVVYVAVPEEELARRLQARRICSRCGANAGPAAADGSRCGRCGGEMIQRRDDNGEVTRERLRVFAQEAGPLVGHYESRPTFFRIDGDQSPDRVAADIRAAIESVLGPTLRLDRGEVSERP